MGFKSRRRASTAAEQRRNSLERVLAAHGGNVSAAARELGCSRVHLHRLIRETEVDTNKFRKARSPTSERRVRAIISEGLAEAIRKRSTMRKARRQFERTYLEHVLALCDYNRRETAKLLNISLSSLKEKLKY